MKTEQPVIDYTNVLNVLTNHIGEAAGISAANIAKAAGVNVRQVRSQVTAMRLDGVAVCGTPETGYFIASCAEELEDCCQFLRSRAMTSLLIESRMRKVPMADLIGQLHLPT